jgi:glutamate 5-kinase
MKNKRWVIKIGSGLLTTEDGLIDHARFADFAAQVRALMEKGYDIILVSSGAIASGMTIMGLSERPKDAAALRACATIGQIELMAEYRRNFAGHGLFPAQLLLTYGDFDSRSCHRNAAATLDRLLGLKKYVPVINENDAIADDEIKFGDNDRLSAHVATLCHAEKLIILSGIDGLLTKLDGTGEVIREVTSLDAVRGLAQGTTGRTNVGGMTTKLLAAEIAAETGCETLIANGRTRGILAAIASGEFLGTTFRLRRADRE